VRLWSLERSVGMPVEQRLPCPRFLVIFLNSSRHIPV
jgi:hypothetical protein